MVVAHPNGINGVAVWRPCYLRPEQRRGTVYLYLVLTGLSERIATATLAGWQLIDSDSL